MSADLAAWLSACYDKAEQLARAAGEAGTDSGLAWHQEDPDHRPGRIVDEHDCVVVYDEGNPDEDEAAHIVATDPAHRLRDIALKRAILADHFPYESGTPVIQRCIRCASDEAYPNGVAIMEAYPCQVARQLGSEFSDKSGYRPDWKPSEAT